jgi:ABC-type multidrug transport system fused ATPase/permease subunit
MRHLLRLRVYIHPYKKQILLALLSLILTTAINLAIPPIIQQVIDVGLGGGEVRFLLRAALVILVIGSMRTGLLYVQRFLSEWIASHSWKPRPKSRTSRMPRTYHLSKVT